MTGVAVVLQGLLSLLLIAALAYGARLERKLRELRESQAGFAKAVQELNQAAARAESGLAMLRTSTEVAREELADRIDTARSLAARLEAVASDAALTVKRLEATQTVSAPSAMGRWRDAPEGPRESADEIFNLQRSDRFAIKPSGPAGPPSRDGEEKRPAPARRLRSDEELFAPAEAPAPATPADRLRQVADLLRGPAAPAAGARR
jgi:hypothetical protein